MNLNYFKTCLILYTITDNTGKEVKSLYIKRSVDRNIPKFFNKLNLFFNSIVSGCTAFYILPICNCLLTILK